LIDDPNPESAAISAALHHAPHEGQDGWDRNKIDEVIASGKTTRVSLKKPIRIVLAYNTASVRNREVYFKEDIYDRDNKVLEGLNEKFKLRISDQ